jgi:hypothetical protein
MARWFWEKRQTCDQCRYWTVGLKNGRIGNCACEKFDYPTEERLPAIDGVMYSDWEGGGASFSTGPKFGCIHWRRIE